MARIVVLTHEFDRFRISRDSASLSAGGSYLLSDVLDVLIERGHSVRVQAGLAEDPEGDVVIVHVDCSVTPKPYLDFASRFPLAVNARIADIRKHTVSGALLARGETWNGPVIVKADLNDRGRAEANHNARAQVLGLPPPHPYVPVRRIYGCYAAAAHVPRRHWNDPRFVVEKFIPEREGDYYAIRNLVFLGPRERCGRTVSSEPLVKASVTIRRDDVEVPPEMR